MSRQLRHVRPEKSPFSKFLAALAMALIVAFVFQNRDVFFPWWFPKGPTQQPAEPMSVQTEKAPDFEKWAPSAGQPTEAGAENESPSGPSTLSCPEVAARLSDFFHLLDKRDYVLAFAPEKGSRAYLSDIVIKLRGNRPQQSSMLSDKNGIIRNLTHFFRALGYDGIIFVKNILVRERADIEDIFGLFYYWTTFSDSECRGAENIGFRVPLPDLAAYAAFFLNSTGGQAYLFRRDPAVRFLTLYYSLLILDRALEKGLYVNGSGLGRHIAPLIKEARTAQGLVYQEEYIRNLVALGGKYGGGE